MLMSPVSSWDGLAGWQFLAFVVNWPSVVFGSVQYWMNECASIVTAAPHNSIDGAPQHDSTTAGDRTLNEPIWLILHLFIGNRFRQHTSRHIDMTNRVFFFFLRSSPHPFTLFSWLLRNAQLSSPNSQYYDTFRMSWRLRGLLENATGVLCLLSGFWTDFYFNQMQTTHGFRYKLDISSFFSLFGNANAASYAWC